ncbi:hypothetical protein B9Q03_14340, partial [Candidatus Marsarchaeota G2 archaeon OSP_D]|jgi:DNA polymerase IV (family X)
MSPGLGGGSAPAAGKSGIGVASAVASLLSPFCLRVQVVGGLRRGEADAPPELMVLPKSDVVFGYPNTVVAGLAGLERQGLLRVVSTGDVVEVEVGGGVHVAIYVVGRVEAWWPTLVVRTGCEEFVRHFAFLASARGYSLDGGVLRRGREGRVVPVRSEYEVFEVCGVPWLNPNERGASTFREKLWAKVGRSE